MVVVPERQNLQTQVGFEELFSVRPSSLLCTAKTTRASGCDLGGRPEEDRAYICWSDTTQKHADQGIAKSSHGLSGVPESDLQGSGFTLATYVAACPHIQTGHDVGKQYSGCTIKVVRSGAQYRQNHRFWGDHLTPDGAKHSQNRLRREELVSRSIP